MTRALASVVPPLYLLTQILLEEALRAEMLYHCKAIETLEPMCVAIRRLEPTRAMDVSV